MTNERMALQKRLISLIDTSVIEWEGDTDFVAPALDTPYYKAYLLRGKPDNLSIDTMERDGIGIFQVTLMFPSNQGTIPMEDKAQEIINHFVGQTIDEVDTKVRILQQPEFIKLDDTNDRFIGAVRIVYQTNKI
jgi:hypothetical protein